MECPGGAVGRQLSTSGLELKRSKWSGICQSISRRESQESSRVPSESCAGGKELKVGSGEGATFTGWREREPSRRLGKENPAKSEKGNPFERRRSTG